MEAVRTSETSVDNHFTRQYNPEDSSEHHTRRRENLKSHMNVACFEAPFPHFPERTKKRQTSVMLAAQLQAVTQTASHRAAFFVRQPHNNL
jgi:hypothetical protein